MAKTEAIIVGSGEFTDRDLDAGGRLLIAADGGLAKLRAIGLTPDIVIGDFDSLGFVPGGGEDPETGDVPGCGPEVITLPTAKDDTDMAAACRLAWDRGCRSLRIYGGSGSRPDHFLANLQLLAHYSRLGGDVRLTAPDFTVYALTDGERVLRSEAGTTVSVFSHTDRAEGVTIAGGAEYRTEDIVLTNTRALGVSNRMTGGEMRVSVRKGTLFIFLYRSPDAAE